MRRPWSRSRWFLPTFSVGVGLIMLAAQAVGGHPGQGVVALIIMSTFAIVVGAGRGDTVRGFRGDGTDERFEEMNLKATAFCGQVLILAVIVAFIVEIARGRTGAPYYWLGAIAGLAYLAGLAWLRARS